MDEASRPLGVRRVVKIARLMLYDANGKAEGMVDRSHPVGVPLGQVIVHRDEVRALTGQGVQVQREGGHKGLSLAGLHLRYLALVKDEAAYELDIEMAHLKAPPGHFPYRGKGLGQKVVEGLAPGKLLFELCRKLTEALVAHGFHLRLERVDSLDHRQYPLYLAVVPGAENLL